MSTEARPECVIVTSIEDAHQLEAFLELNVPSLLADGNLPAFADAIQAIYGIRASAQAQARLTSSPAFQRLAQVVRVELLPHDAPPRPLAGSVSAAPLFSLPADAIWSDGALRHLAALMLAGKRTVFVGTSLLVELDTVSAALASYRRPAHQGTISVPARELVRLGLEHIHPACADGMRTSGGERSLLLQPISSEGVAVHAPDLRPTIHPPQAADAAIRDLSDPSGIHCVTDSDDVCVLRPIAIAPAAVAPGAPTDAPARHVAFTPFRLHLTDMTPARWRRAERRGRLDVDRLLTRRELARLAEAARNMGCRHSAELLTYMLVSGIQARIVRSAGPFVFLLPSDAALAALWPERELLLAPANAPALLALLRTHCIRLERAQFLREVETDREITSENGDRIRLRRTSQWQLEDGGNVVLEPLGPHFVAVVGSLQGLPELTTVAPHRPSPVLSATTASSAPAPRLEEPARAWEELRDGLRRGEPEDAIEPLIASVRFLGIATAATAHMYEGLGWPLASYRGFDHLPDQVRGLPMGRDFWAWHREALRLRLPPSARLRIQLDLLGGAAGRSEVGALPREVDALLAGQELEARARHVEATGQYVQAVSPALFLAPALRALGLARWRTGEAHLGALLLDLHLRLKDGTVINPRVPSTNRSTERLAIRRGTVFSVDGSRFSVVTVGGGAYVPTETVVQVGNAPVVRSFRRMISAIVPRPVYRRIAETISAAVVRIEIARRRLAVEIDRGQSIERLLLSVDRPAER
jgi:hypothetical protein